MSIYNAAVSSHGLSKTYREEVIKSFDNLKEEDLALELSYIERKRNKYCCEAVFRYRLAIALYDEICKRHVDLKSPQLITDVTNPKGDFRV